MAADNPFRDNDFNVDWEEFDNIDYDCIFAETAQKKGSKINSNIHNHTMTIQDMNQFNRQTFSTPSSYLPTPPPPPPFDSPSINNQQLNDDFWNEIFEAKPFTSTVTPSKSTPQKLKCSPPKPSKKSQSIAEQAKYPITPVKRKSKSKSRTNSITDPSNLSFGIQLNTPQKSHTQICNAPRKKKRNKKKRKRSSRKRLESSMESVECKETNKEYSGIKLDKLDEKMETYNAFNTRHSSSKSNDTKHILSYCVSEARRRSSYRFGLKDLDFNPKTFQVMRACHEKPINLFEIGKIISCLKGKQHGWELQEYLIDYRTNGITSPIFEISHAEKGKHLILGCYPRLKEITQFLKYHPIIPIIDSYGIDTIYTPVKYSRRSGFNNFNYAVQHIPYQPIQPIQFQPIQPVQPQMGGARCSTTSMKSW
eukprot:346710_1